MRHTKCDIQTLREKTILTKTERNKIFKVVTDKQNAVCPPDQVFAKLNFEFLLSIGGDLVTDENEYEKLWTLLRTIGETEFYILENIGATITDRNIPFQATISIDDDHNKFQQIVRSFDPPFGWTAYLSDQSRLTGIDRNRRSAIAKSPTIGICVSFLGYGQG
jgi:hypothetical protein